MEGKDKKFYIVGIEPKDGADIEMLLKDIKIKGEIMYLGADEGLREKTECKYAVIINKGDKSRVNYALLGNNTNKEKLKRLVFIEYIKC
jgi:hypothetical protein